MKSRLLLTGLILVVMGIVVAAARGMLTPRGQESRVVLAGRLAGGADAPVKIVEFTDFQCPACAHASEIVHERVRQSGGKMSLELRYFPLAMHAHAYRAALVAECALKQGKFWPMHNVLFRSQKSWEAMADADDYFMVLARGLGLDDVTLMKCLAQPMARAVVDEDIAQGRRMGVKATPTFFVNGEMAVGIEALEKALKAQKR